MFTYDGVHTFLHRNGNFPVAEASFSNAQHIKNRALIDCVLVVIKCY